MQKIDFDSEVESGSGGPVTQVVTSIKENPASKWVAVAIVIVIAIALFA